jgi:hypothetical protein
MTADDMQEAPVSDVDEPAAAAHHAPCNGDWAPTSELDVMIQMYHSSLPSPLKRQLFDGLSKAGVLLHMCGPRPLSLGSACSGTDLCVKVFEALIKYWTDKCGLNFVPFRHVLSVEKATRSKATINGKGWVSGSYRRPRFAPTGTRVDVKQRRFVNACFAPTGARVDVKQRCFVNASV